ncbi:calmodulin-binding transcription activator 4 isoform X2 [Lactuca sativa]|uniref:calmodulin-binding transcription activator 4 isoform X2 n=1 Tax=Lactuca sativa TaxID=4236 RepID=UPI0022AEC509|nr:calmodulin-binding transcription activator 4 isoform X2 [Lactuca sativa]
MMTSGYNIRDLVGEAHIRWLKPGEVLFILQNFEEKQLTHAPPEKPPSGSLFLFNKRVLRFFRKDGHNWRRKKDGRTVGEAHERLKVGNVEALNCYYAHGEHNPSFQRRSYWMLDPLMDHIVLVHYRDITMTGNSGGSISTLSTGSSSLIQSPDSYATPLSRSGGGFSQSTSSPSSVEVSSDVVTMSNGTSPLSLIEGTDNFEIDVALRRIEEQLSLGEENLKDLSLYYSENEISNDSGFSIDDQDYGDVSITNNQQTLIWDDVIEYGGNPVEEKASLPQEIEDFKFPAYTPDRNLSDRYPDFYSTFFDQGQTEMPLESNLGLSISQEQKFNIRDIAPESGSASESTKVLIIGKFTCDSDTYKNKWYCMFGETEVPIEIMQEGVLCCYAPPLPPGKVTVCITSGNRESISETREFEYLEKHRGGKKCWRSSEELLLLVRFVQMLLSEKEGGEEVEESWSQLIEGVLDGSLASYDAIDCLLEELLKEKLKQWLSSSSSSCGLLSKREQGIIHMVSGLGFGWALTPILNSGVGVNFRDINGWTALHWAARFGREKMVAELVASGAFTGAVTDPSHEDPKGKTPASIAATSGHKGLAGYLSEVSLTTHPSLQTQISHNIQPQTTSLNPNNISNEDLSLTDTLAAVRNATQAAACIQSAFRAHSFRKRQQKESFQLEEEDEYGILPSHIETLSTFLKNGNDYNAALSIQKKYRGWKGRKDFLALRQKVVKIQAHVRGHQVRKNYMVFCWAVGVVEKVVLRWRRKGVGLRGFKQGGDETEDEDIVKAFRKEKVDVSIDEAVSRVLSMVDSQQARQQYRRMLLKYRQAKAEREGLESQGGSTSQNDVMNT